MKDYVVTPDTEIELLVLNLQIDNANQLTFNSIEEQEAYFDSLNDFIIEDSTFQRNDYTIRIPLGFDEAIKYTYCRYKNNNKWYYAYITNMTYANSNMTIATLVTDVWQTYMFDIEMGVSFIERCHVTNDTIGANLIPEELETGDYIINKQTFGMTDPFAYQTNGYLICLESTRNPIVKDNSGNKTYPEIIGGSANGLPSIIPKYLYPNTQDGTDMLREDIQNIINISRENENAIQNVYMVHPLAIGKRQTPTYSEFPIPINWVTFPDYVTIGENTINNFKLNDETYTPINNKLLTFPYVYYRVDNGNGSANIYRQEDFKSKSFEAFIYGIVCPGNNIKLVPINYKNTSAIENPTQSYLRRGVNAESLSLGKLPILNWGGDTYTAWLVNNSLYQETTLAKANMERTKSYTTNKYANGIRSLSIDPIKTIGNLLGNRMENDIQDFTTGQEIELLEREQLKEREIANLVPPTIGGNKEVGDANLVTGFTDFCIQSMTIKPRFARIIDGYFYKYGYQVNDTKMIEINTRSKFNYIKTAGANIYGDVPQIFLQTIKNMFNNGVTFWHNPATFLQYSENFNDNIVTN